MYKHRIHNRHYIRKFSHIPAIERDLGQVNIVVSKFSFITVSSFKKAIKACPWLDELFSKDGLLPQMTWNEPFYSRAELPELIKALKSIEPLVAKLKVAGVING